MMKEPQVFPIKGKKDVEVEFHGPEIMVKFDPKKFSVFFGVCDSGSTIKFRVCLADKQSGGKK